MNIDCMDNNIITPQFPYHMVWLATNRCNARCLHCSSNSTSDGDQDELSTAEVVSLIDQLANAGVIDFAISGGEPLLRRDIFDLIRHAKSRNMQVGIASNGLLSKEKIQCLKSSDIDRFQVSLDGFSESHDRLRQVNGIFNVALKTIAIAVELGIPTNVCITINKFNYQRLAEFVSFVSKLGVTRINLSRYIPVGREGGKVDIDPSEWKGVITECKRIQDQNFEGVKIVSHLAQLILLDGYYETVATFAGCQAGRGQGCVSSTGLVWPCVLLPLSLGSIRNTTFREIWSESPIIKNLKDRCSLIGKCACCAHKYKCGGCRAYAWTQTKNYLGQDNRCWL